MLLIQCFGLLTIYITKVSLRVRGTLLTQEQDEYIFLVEAHIFRELANDSLQLDKLLKLIILEPPIR